MIQANFDASKCVTAIRFAAAMLQPIVVYHKIWVLEVTRRKLTKESLQKQRERRGRGKDKQRKRKGQAEERQRKSYGKTKERQGKSKGNAKEKRRKRK